MTEESRQEVPGDGDGAECLPSSVPFHTERVLVGHVHLVIGCGKQILQWNDEMF